MKIGMELLADEIGKSGCNTFHRNLIYYLAKLALNEQYYVLLYSEEYNDLKRLIDEKSNIKLIDIGKRGSTLKRLYDQYITVPLYYKKNGINKVFSDNLVPIMNNGIEVYFRTLTTQQFHSDFPDKYLRKKFRQFATRYACNKSKIVIANSKYTRSEISKYCDIEGKKISVVLEATDYKMFFPISDKIALKNYIKTKYKISNEFIIQISGLYDHKNPMTSIKVVNELRKRGENIDLVLAGADPLNNWPRYYDYCIKNGIERDVHYLGFLMPEEINKLYNSAISLLYPSISETFGIPPLEAMSSGLPVIGSNKSAVPEVVDDGGVIIDPEDIESIADIIIRLKKDQGFKRKLSDKGFKRVQDFSWEKTIKELRDLINNY